MLQVTQSSYKVLKNKKEKYTDNSYQLSKQPVRDQDTAKEGTMELNFSPVMPVHTTHIAAKPQGLTWPAFKNK